ncbi:hypothetical protein LIX60_30930 [Streptomyces sp. S07_1.15]|uniref:hypothetical protein n=1 Tax=Streptomyces sp. S07_1.15 TaxID=2873925 RepID=UPI001D1328FE|nr:hypothetical protein [Streptomyces sp. S07_1.15]MCC3655798.1 hypothetical protein [Streptomyces sp. S07_1.15]
MSLREFTRRRGFSPAAVSRYLSGERLPRKAFLDVLLSEYGQQAGAPLTEDVRQLTFTLYRAALEASGSTVLLELYELEVRLEELTAELERLSSPAAPLQQDAGEPAPSGWRDPEEGEAVLQARRGALHAEQGRIREEIARRESLLGDDHHSRTVPAPVPLPPPAGDNTTGGVPGEGHPLPPSWPRTTVGSRVPWLMATVATVAAAVFFTLWLTKPSSRTASVSTAPPSSAGTLSAPPENTATADSPPPDVGKDTEPEPKKLVKVTAVVRQGKAVDADDANGYIWPAGEYEYGDFQVTAGDDPNGPAVFTGHDAASLAQADAADWATCGQAPSISNEEFPAASLRQGMHLCGITGEGHRAGITIRTHKSDARGELTSVTVDITTWDTP